MKQTLTEIAEILRAVDAGAEWEWNNPSGQETDWCYAKGASNPLFFAAQGWPIRLKPAEPDAEGWIPWHGGECPVDGGSVVEIKTGIGTVSKRIADAFRWRWDWSGTGSDIVAYRIHKEPEPEYVPLGPGDVPPGSVFRGDAWQGEWKNCYIHGGDITPHGVALHRSSTYTTWQSLFDGWQINRSLPLTGKWDPEAWEPCRKLKGGDNE